MSGRVIVITSGKGGVGKTTTNANIGTALARMGKKVVMIDTDLGLRNLDLLLGLENRIVYTIVDVVEERCKLKQALVKDKKNPNLCLLAAAQTRDKSAVTQEQLKEIDYNLDDLRKSLRETEKLPTLYIQRTLRSGQSITSEGNIVIIGDVNPGSEVIAKGDITVWGILGGIAHAGSEGNKYARIRALKMNAIQLRIADTFARRPDSINIPYIQKSDTFIPEEACIRRKQIYIHKMHEV